MEKCVVCVEEGGGGCVCVGGGWVGGWWWERGVCGVGVWGGCVGVWVGGWEGGGLPRARSFLCAFVSFLPVFSGCGRGRGGEGRGEGVFSLVCFPCSRRFRCPFSLALFLERLSGIVNALVLQSYVKTVPLLDVVRSLIQELLEFL